MKYIKYISIACLFVVLLEDSVFSEYNWNKIPFPADLESNDTLFSIHAFNENEAIAAGSNGAIVYVNYSQSIYSPAKCGDNSFRWICFSDSLNGWVVGDNGTIYSTNDRGITWVQHIIDTKSNLNSVESVDKDNVWAVGDSGIILHSSDGGTNWERQTIEINSSISDYFNLIAVAFKNESIGIACGKWNETLTRVVLLTCDAGLHWKEIECTDRINVFDAAFNGKMAVVYMAEDTPYRDFTFSVEDEDLSCFQKVEFKNLKTGNIYSLDHSYSAHKVDEFTIISNQKIYAIDSVDRSKTSWIAGTNGSIYRTTDSFKNWISVDGGKNYSIDHLTKIYFKDGQHGFIGGDNGSLLLSNDSGKTWQFADLPFNSSISIRDIIFCDSLCGVLSTYSKMAYKRSLLNTIDGGRTWQLINEILYENYLIRNVNPKGIFGLSSESIYYNIDGNNWLNQQISTQLSFYDVFPITPDTFFLVGLREDIWEGAIFKSTDFGKSFDVNASVDRSDSKNTYFYSITFSDQSTGWVVGENGIILKSIDSGYTWKRQPSPTTYDLTKIRFCNPDFGWMFGQNRIYLTFDGGDTWQDKSILTSAKVNDVFCSDPQNCWAVGDDGLILHLSNKLEKYIDISFPGKNETFAIGDSVSIKWDSDGISQVSVAISYDGGKNYTVYRNTTDNDGEETIRISANATVSDSCKVRISSVEGTVADESGYFTITQSSAVENRNMALRKPDCYFKGASIHYFLNKGAPVEIIIFTVSGREVYRNRIPLQGKGPVVQKITSGMLKRGCYLAQVNIGGKYFKGKLLIHR